MGGAVASIDFETRASVDLKAGVYRYAEHPDTGVWCLSWRVGDGPVYSWLPGDEDPLELLAHVQAGGEVKAHNMAFDRIIWNLVVRGRMGLAWPKLKPAQVVCSMAQAQAMALPAALDRLSEVIGASESKDKEGKALMLKMRKPRKIEPAVQGVCGHCRGVDGLVENCVECDGVGQVDTPERVIWWDDPVMIKKLAAYCDQDVTAERAVGEKLFPLSPSELDLYRLDQVINDRGTRIDLAFVEKAWGVVEEATRRANTQMWRLTNGVVAKCSEAAKIVSWLQARGIPCESVAKDELDDLVLTAGLLDDQVAVEVLQLRVASASASVKKLKAALASVCFDGRLRGMLQYHAATTGRWAGKIVQPHNLKRVPDGFDVAFAMSVVMMNATPSKIVDALEMVFGNPLDTLSVLLRAMFVAEPCKKYVGGDLANIEGRINAWLAGENWKLQAFRDYDNGVGPDLYKVTAAGILNKSVEAVTKAERQGQGKVPELACGYQGSVGAFQTMGVNYGVFVTDDEAQAIVDGWRGRHPNIVQGWWDVQDAAIDAVMHPGLKVPCYGGKVTYLFDEASDFLFCMIPSGRVLCYAHPSIVKKRITTRKGDEIEKNAVRYWKAKGRAWLPQDLYGGLQCENIVQALARDVLVHGMRGAEAAGYTVVLHVHDELLCEVPDDPRFTAKELETIMARLPAWAEGLPLAAAAWEDYRYTK